MEYELKALDCDKWDKEIHEKQEKANRDNGNPILSGLANLAGKGKYAQLKSENIYMKQQVALLLPKKIAQGVAERTTELEKNVKGKGRLRSCVWMNTINSPKVIIGC